MIETKIICNLCHKSIENDRYKAKLNLCFIREIDLCLECSNKIKEILENKTKIEFEKIF